jgi:hypothetical protein
MRLVRQPLLVLPLLLVGCGSRQDLFIGEILTRSDAGSGSVPSAGMGAQPAGGAGAVAGVGGTVDVGGSSGGSGDAGGSAGTAGTGADNCVDGERPAEGSLLHRYSFNGTGAVATDSISGANGNIIGAMLDGNGNVVMTGDSAQYVDLPNGIVSSLTDVTVVAWTTWKGEAAYPRVLDFGSSDGNYFAVIPKTGFEDQTKPGIGAEMKVAGFDTVTLASTENVKDRDVFVAFVFRGGVDASLYVDFELVAQEATAITLADIDDRNNWLGRSEYAGNPPYQGEYGEFRIYGAALNGCQLRNVLVNGKDEVVSALP